jgi:hypothetical protein
LALLPVLWLCQSVHLKLGQCRLSMSPLDNVIIQALYPTKHIQQYLSGWVALY